MGVALLLAASGPASAATVYKCSGPGGTISYQDAPCKSGTLLKRITPDPAPKAAPAPAASAPTAAPGSAPPAEPRSPPPPPSPSAPPRPTIAWKCTDYKGDSYYSASLNPRRHNVPLYALDQPPPGATVSPEARIWVEDECIEVPNHEACAYYKEQLDFVLAQQRRKVGDENKLERERKRLTAIRNSRCGQ